MLVLGNVGFDLQNTALSGPRVSSVYLNLYDFKGEERCKKNLEENSEN